MLLKLTLLRAGEGAGEHLRVFHSQDAPVINYADKGYTSCWLKQQPGSLPLHPRQQIQENAWRQSYSTEQEFLLPGLQSLCTWPMKQLSNDAFSFTEIDQLLGLQ